MREIVSVTWIMGVECLFEFVFEFGGVESPSSVWLRLRSGYLFPREQRSSWQWRCQPSWMQRGLVFLKVGIREAGDIGIVFAVLAASILSDMRKYHGKRKRMWIVAVIII